MWPAEILVPATQNQGMDIRVHYVCEVGEAIEISVEKQIPVGQNKYFFRQQIYWAISSFL